MFLIKKGHVLFEKMERSKEAISLAPKFLAPKIE